MLGLSLSMRHCFFLARSKPREFRRDSSLSREKAVFGSVQRRLVRRERELQADPCSSFDRLSKSRILQIQRSLLRCAVLGCCVAVCKLCAAQSAPRAKSQQRSTASQSVALSCAARVQILNSLGFATAVSQSSQLIRSWQQLTRSAFL